MKKIYKIFSKIFTIYNNYGFIKGNYILYKLALVKNKTFNLPKIKYPFSIRNMVTDIGIFHQIFINNEYDYDYSLQDSGVIIDAGANIGLFTVLMKNLYPNFEFICIEPDKENFELLKSNTSKYTNINYEFAGLWNKKIKLKVYDKYNTGKSGLVVEEDEINGNVDAVDINYLIEKYNLKYIDLLKIDIEMSEIYVFNENYENWLPKVKVIVIELHDRIEIGCSMSFFNAISKCFKEYSMEVQGENIIIKNLDLLNEN